MGKKQKSLRTILVDKLKESFLSVFPVATLVLLLCMTPFVKVSGQELIIFLLSTLFLIGGIALFNLGADLAMSPMGEHIGVGLSKSKKLFVLLGVSFVMGVFITIAEPDLSVLASQVSNVIDGTILTVTIGVGVGMFLLLGVIKIVYQKDQTALLLLFYLMIFAVTALLFERGRQMFLPLAFDSGGVTTGPITVPFIMALGVGIARTAGGRNSQENSFGLVALCSIGPVLAMLVLPIFFQGEVIYEVADYSMKDHLPAAVLKTAVEAFREVFMALALIVFFFGILQVAILRMSRQSLYQIFSGLAYTLVGLVIFLTAVTIGYMPIGFSLGMELVDGNKHMAVLFSFVLGMTTVLAEPAIHVLNHQVEDVTGGTVSKRQMMIALSIGVGLSVGLSAFRVIMGFSVLYYLIPGYLLALTLSFFVPKLYTAIAFDSGGVASGPLTSSFILPMIIGICVQNRGDEAVLEFAFGMVAMVAMTPLIAIQLLGFRAVMAERTRKRVAMRHIFSAEDAEVIYFEWGD